LRAELLPEARAPPNFPAPVVVDAVAGLVALVSFFTAGLVAAAGFFGCLAAAEAWRFFSF
jgi:hypothetical protein